MEIKEFESKWESLLETLNEKLQLGLLTRLEALNGQYLEGSTIILETNNRIDFEYLNRPQVIQQVNLFIKEEFTEVEEVQVIENI